jgi:hypothetical protein
MDSKSNLTPTDFGVNEAYQALSHFVNVPFGPFPVSRRVIVMTTIPNPKRGNYLTFYNMSLIGVRLIVNGYRFYVPSGGFRRTGPFHEIGLLEVSVYYHDGSGRLCAEAVLPTKCGTPGREGFLVFNQDRSLKPLDPSANESIRGFPIPPGFEVFRLSTPIFDDFRPEQDPDYDVRHGRIISGP